MSGRGWKKFNLDDSDDEFLDEDEKFSGKTALIVLIDATPAMFSTKWGENEDSPFFAAIKICDTMWRTKIVSNPRDLVGILLFGTEKTSNSTFPNIFELQELSTMKVDMVRELGKIKNGDLQWFTDNIGSKEEYDMKDVFWQAKMSFDKAKTNTYTKNIILFTCEDNPHATKPKLQDDVENKFKDLGKIQLNIFTFKENFDLKKFYTRLVGDDESLLMYSPTLDGFSKVVRMKQRLRRPISRSTLEIAPGMKLGVGFYSFVRKAPAPKTVNINIRNNEELERSVNVFRAGTGIPVLKSEERKVITIQGETVSFTLDEVKKLKVLQEPGIKILGYLSARDFNSFCWYRSPGYFLYPDEERITGSKDLFVALLKRCHALEKMPVVRYVLTRGKSPKLGLLIPSVPDGLAKSLFPQGFHIFPIPFSDEVRHYTEDDIVSLVDESPRDLQPLFDTLVKKLSNAKFDVLEIKNPWLQSIWRKLEEEALEEPILEAFDTLTEPNEGLMQQRLKSLPFDIKRQMELVRPTPRALESKKPRIDIAMEARHGRLRDYLDSNGVTAPKYSGKALLIKLVHESLGHRDEENN